MSGNALNNLPSIVTSFVPNFIASATNSQSYVEHSLSRTRSKALCESTSYSAPASKSSAAHWRLCACWNVRLPRRRYPARMFRNSLRHRTGTAQLGSCSSKASAIAVYSPGKYKYASTFESTTIMDVPASSLRQCRVLETSWDSTPPVTGEHYSGLPRWCRGGCATKPRSQATRIGAVVFNGTANREVIHPHADQMMYEAKHSGRNRVVISQKRIEDIL